MMKKIFVCVLLAIGFIQPAFAQTCPSKNYVIGEPVPSYRDDFNEIRLLVGKIHEAYDDKIGYNGLDNKSIVADKLLQGNMSVSGDSLMTVCGLEFDVYPHPANSKDKDNLSFIVKVKNADMFACRRFANSAFMWSSIWGYVATGVDEDVSDLTFDDAKKSDNEYCKRLNVLCTSEKQMKGADLGKICDDDNTTVYIKFL